MRGWITGMCFWRVWCSSSRPKWSDSAVCGCPSVRRSYRLRYFLPTYLAHFNVARCPSAEGKGVASGTSGKRGTELSRPFLPAEQEPVLESKSQSHSAPGTPDLAQI